LTAAGASNDAVEVVIEISTETAVSFVIKDFFTLIFDLLKAGDAFEIEA
jgi:hypothetical protein